MSISGRIEETIENWSKKWKERLAGWMLSWVASGLYRWLEIFEPELIDLSQQTIEKYKTLPNLPPELRAILDKATTEGQPSRVITGWIMTLLGSVFAIFGLGAPLGRSWEYTQDRVVQSYRLDPISAIVSWRRDPEKYAWVFEDLKDQGWTDGRIEALKFYSLFYPNPADLVRWQAREVFEPRMIEKYGLDDELGGIEREPFYKAGMTDEQITNYWRAHWEHASWMQMVEMLHRQLVTEEEVWEWFRLVEIVPYWRQKLIDSAWNVPTRVDVRRFWDMGTIDEDRLREIYTAQGYHGKDLDDYVLWTKVYVAFPDLVARYKNGWITREEVLDELVSLGMDRDRAEELFQTKFKAASEERTAKERDLTAAEIIRGVKRGVISSREGIELLIDLGYDEWEAEYKIAIDVEALSGSPETFDQFKAITDKYRLARKGGTVGIPEELKQASEQVVRLSKDVDSLQKQLKDLNQQTIDISPVPEDIIRQKTALEAEAANAERGLALAKSKYADLMAQWHHKEA